MKLWHSVKDMPELADFSDNEKQNIMADSLLRVYGYWQGWAALIGSCMLIPIGMSVGGILGGVIAGGISGYFLLPVGTRIQEREIRKLVAERRPKSAA